MSDNPIVDIEKTVALREAEASTTELERRVAKAMWESEGWHHYENNETIFRKWEDLSEASKEYEVKRARAALKAHAEWLAEQEAVRPRHYVPPITQP